MLTAPPGQIAAGVEKLIEIGGDERIRFRRDGNHGVADRERGEHDGEETEQGRFCGANDSHGSDWLIHSERDIAERWIVDGAVKLVSPCRVGEDALEAEIQFRRGLFRTDDRSEPADDFVAALREILGAVVKNLCANMCGCFCPGRGVAGSPDGIANVFSIS